MRKLLIGILVCLSTILIGCSNEPDGLRHKYINDEDYLTLVDMLNDPVMNGSELDYIAVINSYSYNISSDLFLNQYSMYDIYSYKKYFHVLNSNTIEENDILSNTTLTYLENVNIASLDHFSEIVLDSYSDEFSYYSVKDFMPLALKLAEDVNFEFYLNATSLDKNKYSLTGTIDKLNLDNDVHEALLQISNEYSLLYDKENLEISLSFSTNKSNTYFNSTFELRINDTVITVIV